MKKIDFSHPHRRRHFEFFSAMTNPHFNICAAVDISRLLPLLKAKKRAFTPSIVYLISRVTNEIPEFRWRIRDGEVVEHDEIHPSFTVFTEVADVFSFCTVKYENDFTAFHERALARIAEMEQNPSFEDEAGRDDFLFLSAIPWISFTSFQHAMQLDPADSVPRIVWGKYFEENGQVKMPLSVQVHHAVVDGRHVGAFFQKMEAYLQAPEIWMK